MITQSELKRLLEYDPATGVFIWKYRPNGHNSFNTKYAGKIAGSNTWDGYRVIKIKPTTHQAHRLAWLYVYGTFPKDTVDHINFNKSDNRIENLRDIPMLENCRRMPPDHGLRPPGISGVKGVYPLPNSPGLWKTIKGGRFNTVEEALASLNSSVDIHRATV